MILSSLPIGATISGISLSVCIICGNMKLISHFAKIIALAFFVCQPFEIKNMKKISHFVFRLLILQKRQKSVIISKSAYRAQIDKVGCYGTGSAQASAGALDRKEK